MEIRSGTSGAALMVTDNTTTVTNVSEIILSGASVVDLGGGNAEVIISATGYLSFIFTNHASNIATYYDMDSLSVYVPGTIANVATPGVSTTPTLLQSFATQLGYPNITDIPAGIFNVHFETEKVAGSNNYYCYAEIYKRSSGGTETLLVTTDHTTQTASNTVIQQYCYAVTSSSISILDTDRIVVKIYAVMLSSTATINLLWDDTTNARLELPSAAVDVTNFVPYVGATTNVNLGTKTITTPTAIGSTSASGTLTLSSTSNATKGKILFGTSAYDEVNNRLGVGIAAPTATLHVSTPTNGTQTGDTILKLTGVNPSGTGNLTTYKYFGTMQMASDVGLGLASSGIMSLLTTSYASQIQIGGSSVSINNGNLLVGTTTNGTSKLDVSAAMGNGTIPFLASTVSDTTRSFRVTTGIISTAAYDVGGIWVTTATPTAANAILVGDNSGNSYFNASTGAGQYFQINNANLMQFTKSGGLSLGNTYYSTDPGAGNMIIQGTLGIGIKPATALLHLGAGTATAGTAPLKLTAGTLLSVLELGAMEFVDNGTTGHLYITLNVGGVLTRVQIV